MDKFQNFTLPYLEYTIQLVTRGTMRVGVKAKDPTLPAHPCRVELPAYTLVP